MGRGEGFGSAKDAKHAKKCEGSRMWSWSHCRIHAFAAHGCASAASGCSRHPASRTTRTSCTSQDAQERPRSEPTYDATQTLASISRVPASDQSLGGEDDGVLPLSGRLLRTWTARGAAHS